MSDARESPSDLELLRIEMGVLWGLDDRRRLRGSVRLAVGISYDGTVAVLGERVPDHVAEQVVTLLRQRAPVRPDEPPAAMPACRELLTATGTSELTLSGGPSYYVAASVAAASRAPVLRSDSPDAHRVWNRRPPIWEPDEWADLVVGRAGAPWAMVLRDEQVVSVCHTPRRTSDGAEAGTWTDPAFRGRGYAAAATAAWADLLGVDCPHLFYSTSAENRSSQRVAARLGLRPIGWIWKLDAESPG